MAIRADIDKQDLLNAERDTRKWLNSAAVSLIATLSILTLVLTAAGAFAYQSARAITASAAWSGGAGLVELYRAETTSVIELLTDVIIVVLTVFIGYGVFRSRREQALNQRKDTVKHGFSTGRFEYMFADKHLIIKGPLKIKKIAWTAFSGMEETPSSIIFRYEDGSFEFIPKNVLPDNITFEKLWAEYQPRIEQALPFEEALHVKSLTVTYELLRSDGNEYLDRYFGRLDGKLAFIRRFAQWPPLTSFLFFAFILTAAAAFAGALHSMNLTLAAFGVVFAMSAVALFLLKSEHFRGAAHPLFREEPWPFAQSTLTSVTLSKEAVFWRERGVQQVIPWDGFEELMECPLAAYLVISPGRAIALPKRAFISAQHYHSFIGFANSRIGVAKRAREERKQRRLTGSYAKPASAPTAEPAPEPEPLPAEEPGGEVEQFPAEPKPARAKKRDAAAAVRHVIRQQAG